MRMPIKLSAGPGAGRLCAWLPRRANPGGLVLADRRAVDPARWDTREAFALHASSFTEGPTWRSTSPRRHEATHEAIARLPAGERRRILDAGVSDGVTSLELIERLGDGFERFYATDRRIEVSYMRRRGKLYFYEASGACVLVSTRRWIVYRSPGGWLPFRWMARWCLSRAPRASYERLDRLSLVQPELRALAKTDDRIVIRCYDVFDPWDGELLDLVKVANLLNPAYFEDKQIRRAVVCLGSALREGGRLYITDNRRGRREKFSVLRRDGSRLVLENRVEGGSEVTELALDVPLPETNHAPVADPSR